MLTRILPLFLLLWSATTFAQPVCIEVQHEVKISDLSGNFNGTLSNLDRFGRSGSPIGDVNGDGVMDLAIGAYFGGPSDEGAVWVLLMNANGTVSSEVEIADGMGGFTGALDANDQFGAAVCGIGDLNNDGVPDLAVGANQDDDGGTNRGAVWILFLNANGTVSSHQKISDTQGNFFALLGNSDIFGISVDTVGDVNADGVTDLVVGAMLDDDGTADAGAAYILMMNTTGTVSSFSKISATQGGFTGTLDLNDRFGSAVTTIGDLNNDGVPDVVIAAHQDDDGGLDRGAVYVIFLTNTGSVSSFQKIGSGSGAFLGPIDNFDQFGLAVSGSMDFDGDGNNELLVGASGDDDGGSNRGAVWILYLGTNGSVILERKISDTFLNFNGGLDDNDRFGIDLGAMGDLDNDGTIDLMVTAYLDDDGGSDRGAAYILYMIDTCVNPFTCDTTQTKFTAAYGLGQADEGEAIVQTTDGGFAIAGKTTSSGAGGADFYLLKVDNTGQQQWAKTYGTSNWEEGNSVSVIQTSDQGFLLGGDVIVTANGLNGVIVKVDASGNIQWQSGVGGTATDRLRDATQTFDGGYITCGTQSSSSVGSSDGFLAKFTSTGSFEWFRAFGGSSADHLTQVLQTADSGYIACGAYRSVGNSDNTAYIIRVDGFGNKLWEQLYGSTSTNEGFLGMTQATDGGFACIGLTDGLGSGGGREILLIKIDANGNQEWAKTYGGANDERGVSIINTPDGGYVFSATTASFGPGSSNMLVTKVNAFGVVEWSKYYGGTGIDDFALWGKNVVATSDSGYAFTGWSTSISGLGGNNEVVLYKVDGCGNGACNSGDVSLVSDAVSVGEVASNFAINFGISTGTTTMIDSAFAFNDSLVCSETNCETDTAFTISADSLCLGDSILITYSGDSADTVNWDFGGGNFLATGPDTSFWYTYPSFGSFNISATSIYACTTATVTQLVAVFDSPQAAFSLSDSVLCLGEAVQVTDLTFITDTGFTLNGAWDMGDSTILNDPSSPFSHTYQDTGTYVIQSVMTTFFGCADSAFDTVMVYPVPVASFITDGSCEDDTVTFISTSQVFNGLDSLSWDVFLDGTTEIVGDSGTFVFASPGNYSVGFTVVESLGCMATDTGNVQINPKPTPNFGFINTCFGDTTVFTDSSTIGTSSSIVDLIWHYGDSTLPDTTNNPFHVYSDTGSYQVILQVISSSGCVAYDTQTVVIHSLPVAHFGFDTVCFQDTVPFIDSSTSISGTITNWNWLFGDGFSSTDPNPNHLYQTNDTFAVTLVVTSSFGCVDTTVQDVFMYSLPTAAFTLQNECESDSVTLSSTSVSNNGSPLSSFAWDLFADGSTEYTVADTSHPFTNWGTYAVNLLVVDSLGCRSDTTDSVIVHPRPVPNFGALNACFGDSIHFSDSSTIAQGSIASYSWDFGDGSALNTTQNPIYLYGDTGLYTVSLQLISDSGCAAYQPDSQQVEIYKLPVAHFGFNNACQDDSVFFTDSSTTLSGVITNWNWSFGNGASAVLTNPGQVYTAAGTYQVQLLVETDLGCLDSVTQAVQIYSLPQADFLAQNACEGTSVALTDQTVSTNGSVISGWSWDILFDGTVDYTQQNPNHVFGAWGTYPIRLQVIDTLGCRDSILDSIVIHPNPVADFSSINVCLGAPTFFFDSSEVAQGDIIDWDWDFGDGSGTANIQNPQYSYQAAGTYPIELIVTTDSSCSDTSSGLITIVIFPLPSTDFSFANHCHQDTMEFTDQTTITSGTIDSWVWTFGEGSASSSQQNPQYLYANPGLYPVSLFATSDEGCATLAVDTVEVFELPSVAFSTSNVCLNDSAYFINQTTIGDGVVGAWAWDFGDGMQSTLETPAHLYLTADTLEVLLIATTDSTLCSDSAKQTLVVYPLPTVDFSFSNVCEDSVATFTDQSTGNASAPIDQWYWDVENDASIDYLTSSITHVFANPGTYPIELRTVDTLGCTDSLVESIVIHPQPQASFTTVNVCFGDSVYVTNQSTVATGGITQWAYNYGDGASYSLPDPVHFFATHDTFRIELQVLSDSGCHSAVFADSVVVHPQPTVNFSAANVCAYDSVFFVNQTTIPAPGSINSYSWNLGDGQASSTVQDPVYKYSSFGSYTVSLIAESNQGCLDTAVGGVLIHAVPEVQFTAQPVCVDDVYTFRNLSTIGAGIVDSWEWTFGDGGTSTLEEPDHSYTALDTFSVSLIATSDSGCVDSLRKSMTTFSVPVAQFINDSACAESPMSFVDQSTNESGPITNWYWDFGDQQTDSSLSTPTNTYTDGGFYDVTLTVTAINGCTDDTTMQVEVFALPDPAFVPDLSEACAPVEILFDNQTIYPPGSTPSVRWTVEGDANVYTDENLLYRFDNRSDSVWSIDVQLTASTGFCSRSFVLPDAFRILPKPEAAFVASPDSGTTFDNLIRFLNQSQPDRLEYLWDFGDGSSFSTELNPEHLFDLAGNYEVELAVENPYGCLDTARQMIVITPITTYYVPSAFTPNSDLVNDGFRGYGEYVDWEFDLQVFDRWGELIFQTKDPKESWDGIVKGQPAQQGVYIWKVHYREAHTGAHIDLNGTVTLLRNSNR